LKLYNHNYIEHAYVADDVYIRHGGGTNIGAHTFTVC